MREANIHHMLKVRNWKWHICLHALHVCTCEQGKCFHVCNYCYLRWEFSHLERHHTSFSDKPLKKITSVCVCACVECIFVSCACVYAFSLNHIILLKGVFYPSVTIKMDISTFDSTCYTCCGKGALVLQHSMATTTYLNLTLVFLDLWK